MNTVSDDEVIHTICDLATTGMWSIFDVADLYKDVLSGNDIWELCKRMMGEGLVRIDSRGMLNVYH